MKQIVVIGAGVNGLSCAVKLAENFYRQSVQLTLVSEDVTPNTTGDLSAGLWGPYLIGSTSEQKIVEWSKISHDYFHKLWSNGKAEEAGITMIPIYRLTTDPQGQEDPCWKDVVFGYQKLNPNEIKILGDEHGRSYTAGNHFITFCAEPIKFLPYLMKRFLKAGGRFQQKKVVSLDEFDSYDLIVNCTGLYSKDLTNDAKLQPIRGQVARVKAPWIYEAVLHEDDDGNYIIPNTKECVLGGTHQVGDYDLKVSAADSAFIFNGCQKLCPSLKSAETINEKVGLRPGRSEVLLKVEKRLQKPIIIHNTGHGGCGVTLCWGCSDDVLSKAIEILKISLKVSKL